MNMMVATEVAIAVQSVQATYVLSVHAWVKVYLIRGYNSEQNIHHGLLAVIIF